MLVGRTVGGEVGVLVVKLWGDGVGLVVDDDVEVDMGLEGAGPASKSHQSSKASSSQAGGWGLDWMVDFVWMVALDLVERVALVGVPAFMGSMAFA